MSSPKFIVVEGLDGSGKTTIVEFIRTLHRAAGVPVVINSSSSATPFAQAIRGVVIDEVSRGVSHNALALLVNAARRDIVERYIEPALVAGDNVVSDRWTLSTAVYQCDADDLLLVNTIGGMDMEPDLVIILDVDYATSMERLKRRHVAADHLESCSPDVFAHRHQILLQHAVQHPFNTKVVDATPSTEVVCNAIYALIWPLLQ